MDTSPAALNFDIIAPEIVLLAVASALLLLGTLTRNKGFTVYLALAGLIVGIIVTIGQWNQPESGFFGMVMIDNFGVLFNLIFMSAGIITILMARQYMIQRGIDRFEFYGLLLFSTVGMMIMAASTDLLVIFLGLEIMSIPLYVMAGLARHDTASNEAAIKYFIMGAFATGFLLYGIALIYGSAETTDLQRLLTDFAFIKANAGIYLYAGAILVLFGFAFKIAAVPFHMWVPDVYTGAPTPVTAYFSVAPKAAGFAALLRIFVYGFPAMTELSSLFWILAVLTMSIGNLLAIFQDNIKRMLAYSSIAHAGYILVALTAGGEGAVSSAVYYLMAYLFFNLGGFTIVTMIDSRQGSRALIAEMKGLAAKYPILAALLALFMFALAGFPPTAGFFGKFYVFSEAVKNDYVGLVIIAVINSFVSVYYYLRVVVVAFFGQPDQSVPLSVTYKPALVLVLLVTAAGTLLLGFFPEYILQLTRTNVFPFI